MKTVVSAVSEYTEAMHATFLRIKTGGQVNTNPVGGRKLPW